MFTTLMYLAGLLIFLYFALCLQVIGKKTNTPDDWLAWIPFVNLYYMIRISGKPDRWVLFLFVPFWNLFLLAQVWDAIIEKRRGQPSTDGWLLLIPVLNYLVLTRLAFVDEPASDR